MEPQKRKGCENWRIALDGPTRYEAVLSGARSCVIMDVSAKTNQLLYAACDMRAPWDLHLSDLNGKQERRLTRLNDAVLTHWPRMHVEQLGEIRDASQPQSSSRNISEPLWREGC